MQGHTAIHSLLIKSNLCVREEANWFNVISDSPSRPDDAQTKDKQKDSFFFIPKFGKCKRPSCLSSKEIPYLTNTRVEVGQNGGLGRLKRVHTEGKVWEKSRKVNHAPRSNFSASEKTNREKKPPRINSAARTFRHAGTFYYIGTQLRLVFIATIVWYFLFSMAEWILL